jgi:imidazolonepropionase-like amidohydrolase
MLTLTFLAAFGIAQQPIAFVGVHVVPMDSARVLRDQTVVVEQGRITAMGAHATVRVPSGSTRIDGGGRYLMPGFADMHVHAALSGDFALYLAFGVTTVAHMGSSSVRRVVAWRDSVRAGQLDGPDILASAFLNTIPGGAEGARVAVARADSGGADFIKVYNNPTADQFAAIVDAARRRGLPVVGHAVRSVGLKRGFAEGQVAVVHAEEYIYADFENRPDTSLIPGAVAFTRRSGAYVIPNLSAYTVIARQWGRPAVIDTLLAAEDARALPPFWVQRWRWSDYVRRPGTIDPRVPFLARLTRALYEGGVPLLLGSDSPGIPGMQPGASLHEDLRLMIAAGLTPFDALVAGTRNAGTFVATHFRRGERFGIVAPGARADLLLLDGDPLQNVEYARRPAGVMARGRWYPRDSLVALVVRAREAGRTAATEVQRVLDERGVDAALAHHRLLRRDSTARYRFSEEEFNDMGYALLGAGDAPAARAIFRLNTEDYPGSANAFDSYADAVLALKDSTAAAEAYRRVLALLGSSDSLAENRTVLETNARRFLATRQWLPVTPTRWWPAAWSSRHRRRG